MFACASKPPRTRNPPAQRPVEAVFRLGWTVGVKGGQASEDDSLRGSRTSPLGGAVLDRRPPKLNRSSGAHPRPPVPCAPARSTRARARRRRSRTSEACCAPLARREPDHLERGHGGLYGVRRKPEPFDELVETIAVIRWVDDELEQHDLLSVILEAVGVGQRARGPTVTVVMQRSFLSCAGPGDVGASPGALLPKGLMPIAMTARSSPPYCGATSS
jgi:hypothetical protein